MNYELDHEEFKASLGLKIKGDNDRMMEEKQPSHVPTLTFGTIEMVSNAAISGPTVAMIKSMVRLELK